MPRPTLLIGLGQIGMGYDLMLDPAQHINTHARAFSSHPAFTLIAAVDPSAPLRARFTDHYGQPAYATLHEALARHAPEVVIIAAPTGMHAPLLSQLLQHPGITAILCEKPLAPTLDEARAMVSACHRAGTALFVNYIRRVDAGVQEIARRIKSGQIARPIKGIVWYSKGLLHNGSHFINLLEFWLGPVTATRVLDPGRTTPDNDREPDLHITFQHGTMLFLAAWEEAFSHYTIELLSPSGRLRYEAGGSMINWQPAVADPLIAGYNMLQQQAETIPNTMHLIQWHVADQLVAALAQQPATLCTGHEALATLETLHHLLNPQS